jgi:hypothetical protein
MTLEEAAGLRRSRPPLVVTTATRSRAGNCAELLAIDVYKRAENAGQPVSMGMVQRRLGEVANPRPKGKRPQVGAGAARKANG